MAVLLSLYLSSALPVFMQLHLSYMTDLLTCPRSQVMIVPTLDQNTPLCFSKGWLGTCPSAVSPGKQ